MNEVVVVCLETKKEVSKRVLLREGLERALPCSIELTVGTRNGIVLVYGGWNNLVTWFFLDRPLEGGEIVVLATPWD